MDKQIIWYYVYMERDRIKNDYVTKSDIVKMDKNFKDYVGALYEKFHGDIKLVIEGQSGIGERLERVENKVDMLTETVGDIKVELTGNKMDLNNKVNRSEYKGLERRVIALETKV